MDAAVLFFLPLIAGYTFSVIWHVPRFRVLRETGHKLYFRAGFYGFFLYIYAAAIILIVAFERNWAFDNEFFLAYSGVKHPDIAFHVSNELFLILSNVFTIPLAILLAPLFICLALHLNAEYCGPLSHKTILRN